MSESTGDKESPIDEEFEAWAATVGYNERLIDWKRKEHAWKGWQAARAKSAAEHKALLKLQAYCGDPSNDGYRSLGSGLVRKIVDEALSASGQSHEDAPAKSTEATLKTSESEFGAEVRRAAAEKLSFFNRMTAATVAQEPAAPAIAEVISMIDSHLTADSKPGPATLNYWKRTLEGASQEQPPQEPVADPAAKDGRLMSAAFADELIRAIDGASADGKGASK